MTDHVETIIIGAGVIGLAIAHKLARSGQEVIILEAENAIGTGSSARNSEVIHSGIYYPTNSLKARLCVAGRKALYQYCDTFSVAQKKLGKLIVATSKDEIKTLQFLQQKATANGVHDLIWLSVEEARRREPELKCTAALLSPSTGIIDSHGYMLSLQGDAEAHGTVIAFNSPLTKGRVNAEASANSPNRFTIHTGGDSPAELSCKNLIIAAGHGAQTAAHAIDGIPKDSIPPQFRAKGNYFVLSGKSPFRHLVYPAPVAGGLGIHSTLDMGNQTKFGPDVEWIDSPDYVVDPARARTFYTAIRKYWPGLPDGALEPGYVGIRPKVVGPNDANADFMIMGMTQHGIAGLVNLFGIESPGLTASLAIADYTAELLNEV